MKYREINRNIFFSQVDKNIKNFSYCIFTFDINLENLDLLDCIFDFSKFNKPVKILSCNLFKNSFVKAEFYEEVLFQKSIFIEATFQSATFEKSFKSTDSNVFEDINFQQVLFKDKVIFNQSVFKGIVSFNLTLFSRYAYFEDSLFLGTLSIIDVKCLNQFSLRNSVFLDRININRSSFDRRLDFEKAIINILNFSMSTAYSNVIMCDAIILNSLIIHSTTIQGIFDTRKLMLTNNSSEINSRLVGLNLVQKIEYSPETSNIPTVDLSGSIFRNFDINIDPVCFKNRETLKALKHSFFQNGNIIEGMLYHCLEMEFYRNELQQKIRSNEIKSTRQKIYIAAEYFMLSMNKNSNNHGLSWTRGVTFIVIVTTLFYSIFLLLISNHLVFELNVLSIGNTLKFFLQFMNIANWSYAPFCIDDYSWAYVPLFIGRIFIGYGVYQTVQAFRKYGKV